MSEMDEKGIKSEFNSDNWYDMDLLATYALDNLQERIDSARDCPISGMTTGIRDLDDMTQGLRAGELVWMDTTVGHSATRMALHVAIHFSIQAQPVAYFSLGTGARYLAQRVISSLAKVNFEQMRSGQLSAESWGRIPTAITRARQIPLFIDDAPALSMSDLMERICALQEQWICPRLIVVDDLQAMDIRHDTDGKQSLCNLPVGGLKEFALMFGCPVFVIHKQIQVESRHLLISLGLNKQTIRHVDLLIRLDEPARLQNICDTVTELSILKNTYGVRGSIRLNWSDIGMM